MQRDVHFPVHLTTDWRNNYTLVLFFLVGSWSLGFTSGSDFVGITFRGSLLSEVYGITVGQFRNNTMKFSLGFKVKENKTSQIIHPSTQIYLVLIHSHILYIYV